jgi:hypothetical protein
MIDIVLDIDIEGNIRCLWTDEINLFAIGKVVNMRRASDVEFNQDEQTWEVRSLSGKVLYKNPNRTAAIDWEIKEFSLGGQYYEEGTL